MSQPIESVFPKLVNPTRIHDKMEHHEVNPTKVLNLTKHLVFPLHQHTFSQSRLASVPRVKTSSPLCFCCRLSFSSLNLARRFLASSSSALDYNQRRQMAKFDPFLSIDCAGSEGGWERSSRRGRDQILLRNIAGPYVVH